MKSKATTVAQYLDSLPPDRRDAIQAVRRVILENLGLARPNTKGEFVECMQYGVIGYCVPHSVWPHGHHTRPELPLMYMGLSSQKNDMVVYMLCLLHNKPMREWFEKAWKATGRKLHIDTGGMGCCLRFKKLDELSLDVIAETMRRIPVTKYLEAHADMLSRIGKSPDGRAVRKKAIVKRDSSDARSSGGPGSTQGAKAKPPQSTTRPKRARTSESKATTRVGRTHSKKGRRKTA